MPGFIHDHLEIKFLILYVVSRLVEPVPFATVLELALCDDGVGYFDFTECLRDLVDSGHLTLSEEGLYAITEKGRRNGEICQSELPYTVRLKCDRNVEECNRKLRRKRQVRVRVEKRRNGTCTARMVLDDDVGNVMDLKLVAPREDMAQVLADRFRKSPGKIYSAIVSLILDGGQEQNAI